MTTCPHCGSEINSLIQHQTHVTVRHDGYCFTSTGANKLSIEYGSGMLDSTETTDETETTWRCPHCDGDVEAENPETGARLEVEEI